MKGEYRDDKNPPNMFSKFHHHHNHHQPPPPPQHFAITGHHFQHHTNNNTSEEADSRSRSRSSPTHTITPTIKNHDVISKNHDVSTTGGGNNDGASIEVIRRPRGRPPGSKNKPKPPIVITREPDPSMSPYVLELPGGTDIVDAVANYCRKRNTGLCILTASGTVANVTLRQPTTTVTPGATVTFHGRFDILSLSATVLPSSSAAAVAPFANGFTISLAGPQGQIVGGAVAGQLISAGTVYIIATSFNNPLYHRLPSSEEDDDNNVRNSGGGNTGSAGGSEQSPPPESGGHHLTAPPSTAADSMSMYSCHMPSDVIWAPTPRQAPPHPPPY